ncbi:MAG: aldo/keto reductase [Planctomycetes bacterium]|nr:aldo/keto reductase [Planctomycetota bacterium]
MSALDWFTAASGVRVPQLIYGTAWKKERTAELVAQALAAGFRGIDTACQPKHYDEERVGEAIADALSRRVLRREELYLQTKFTSVDGQDPRRIPYDPRAPLSEQVAQSFARSLRNLRTTYLDALVLHSPLATRAQTSEVWRAMQALCDGQRVRQLGLSNCYDLRELRWLCEAHELAPSVLQNRFYAETGYDRELRAYCKERGILYQSFWTLSANPRLLAHPTVRSIAAHRAATPAQILFRWLTLEGCAPLTGTQSAEHMRESLAIFGIELGGEERARIGALLHG